MRDIKFRMWDKINKTIIKDIHDSEEFWLVINNNLYDIMQYTGLKDKNGKEIYEGDIVYCQTKYGKAKAIIKFIDGKFVAYWNSAITHPQNRHHIACYDINKKFEVIGNVWEDSDLLNDRLRGNSFNQVRFIEG